jgi:HlyD family secretion protein
MATNGKKKNKKKLFIFTGIGVVVIALVLVVVLGSKKENVVTVQTEKVTKRTITQVVNASGKIQPETAVKINAEVSGEITVLPVKEGDRVKKGTLLVRIKPDQYQAQVDRADAGLALAQANLEKAESEYKRSEELFQKKLLSEQEFVTFKTNYTVNKSQYSSAVASLRDAKESLSKTSIYAPMDGTVSQLLSELGERVSGSSFTQGTQIMTVSDLSMMEARVDVGENDIVLIAIGDTARIQVDAYPDKKFAGIVYEIANTATTTNLGSQDGVTNF